MQFMIMDDEINPWSRDEEEQYKERIRKWLREDGVLKPHHSTEMNALLADTYIKGLQRMVKYMKENSRKTKLTMKAKRTYRERVILREHSGKPSSI